MTCRAALRASPRFPTVIYRLFLLLALLLPYCCTSRLLLRGDDKPANDNTVRDSQLDTGLITQWDKQTTSQAPNKTPPPPGSKPPDKPPGGPTPDTNDSAPDDSNHPKPDDSKPPPGPPPRTDDPIPPPTGPPTEATSYPPRAPTLKLDNSKLIASDDPTAEPPSPARPPRTAKALTSSPSTAPAPRVPLPASPANPPPKPISTSSAAAPVPSISVSVDSARPTSAAVATTKPPTTPTLQAPTNPPPIQHYDFASLLAASPLTPVNRAPTTLRTTTAPPPTPPTDALYDLGRVIRYSLNASAAYDLTGEGAAPLAIAPADAASNSSFLPHEDEKECKGFVTRDAAMTTNGYTNLNVQYRGGAVLDAMYVHVIFLGSDWMSGTSAVNTTMAASIFFTANLAATPWWDINRYYPEAPAARKTAQCALRLVESKVHDVPDSDILDEATLVSQLQSYIMDGDVAFYPGRSSYVFMLPDTSPRQFTKLNGQRSCVDWCAFHNYATATITVKGRPTQQRIPYAVVANPMSCGRSNLWFCAQKDIAANPASAPNGVQADAMISFLGHELAEICTDPHFKSWFDDKGLENADKCVMDFGTVQRNAQGRLYNMMVRNKPFLVQSNWHLPSRSCEMSP